MKEDREKKSDAGDAASMQKRGLTYIVVFLVVGLIALGAYALWRQTGNKSQGGGQAQQAEQAAVGNGGGASRTPSESERIDKILKGLTTEQKVAQLFVVTPEQLTDVEVAVSAGETTRAAATRYPVGGLCYFSGNLQSPKQTQEMLRNTGNYIKDACGLVPFLCVDEEGGTVSRVASNKAFGVTDPGNMNAVGAEGDVDQARVVARNIASYLKKLGFNVDFAPVADIDQPEGGTMRQRSFGSTPDLVASMVVAQIDGFSREGVLCAAKHFPGIGGAEGDSHNGRIYSHRTEDEMKSMELVPFVEAIKADVPMIMVGHLTCLELARGEGDTPASLSPKVMRDLLRNDLGYDGVIVTDALNMDAIKDVCKPSEVAVRAIQAGADVVLMPNDFKAAYNGLLDAVKNGTIGEERIDESLRRIICLKLKIS